MLIRHSLSSFSSIFFSIRSQQIDRSPVSSKEAGIEAEVKKVETTKPSNRGSLLRKRNKNQPAFILPISNEKGKESIEKGKDEKKEKQRSPYSPSNLIFWTWDQVKWMLPILKNWSMMKPVIRSTILAWICLLMLLITPIEAVSRDETESVSLTRSSPLAELSSSTFLLFFLSVSDRGWVKLLSWFS